MIVRFRNCAFGIFQSMPDSIAVSTRIVAVEPLDSPSSSKLMTTLVQTRKLKVIYLKVTHGMTVPRHEFPGEMVIHCLEGRVLIESSRGTYSLCGGQLLCYVSDEPFSIQGVDDAALFIFIAISSDGRSTELIG
jgi:hypothetical protein